MLPGSSSNILDHKFSSKSHYIPWEYQENMKKRPIQWFYIYTDIQEWNKNGSIHKL